MRIATWNLNVKVRNGALDLFRELDADVLLLTEAPPDLELPGYERTPQGPLMLRGQEWATILSKRTIEKVERPHGSTVAAVIDGVTYVSTVLPWGSSPPGPPFRGVGQAAQTVATLEDLEPWLQAQDRLIWGGDWNHSLEQPWRYSASTAGREGLDALLYDLELHAPTRHLPRGWKYDFPAIDHVAVPDPAATARHVPAVVGERRLSDHDAYVVVTTDKVGWRESGGGRAGRTDGGR